MVLQKQIDYNYNKILIIVVVTLCNVLLMGCAKLEIPKLSSPYIKAKTSIGGVCNCWKANEEKKFLSPFYSSTSTAMAL